MKRNYQIVLAVSAVLIFFTNLAVYLSLPQVAELSPWYWTGAFAVAAAPIFLSRAALVVLRRSPVTYWCYGFAMLSAVWLLFQGAVSDGAWQEMRLRTVSALLLLILMIIFSNDAARKWGARAMVAAVLIAVGINVFELFNPLTFSLASGRSAGLYVISTQTGAALIAGMILGISALPQRLRLAFALVVGVGVLLTFSRGPMLAWLVIMVVLVRTREIDLRRSLAVGGAIAVLAVALMIPFWDTLVAELKDIGVLNKDVIGRLEGFTRVDEFGVDDSAAKRKEVASMAWDMIGDKPVFGYGVAASKDWDFGMGTHNQYLSLTVDHGVAGLLLLPLLVLAATWRVRGEARSTAIAYAVFALMLGWFSDHVLEDHFMISTFALLAARVIASRIEQTPQPAAQQKNRVMVLAENVS